MALHHDQDAARWLQLLSKTRVTNDALLSFRSWRADPQNRAAYERLETRAEELRGYINHPELLAIFATAHVRRRPSAKA
jgi:ferric-dicitrate binding protein FerR (iron transport regulator)